MQPILEYLINPLEQFKVAWPVVATFVIMKLGKAFKPKLTSYTQKLHGTIRRFFRSRARRTAVHIKNDRHNCNKINVEIAKNAVYFSLFVLSLFSTWVAAVILLGLGKIGNATPLIYSCGAPILIFEFLWLSQNTYVEELIKSAARLRRA
ncbi:hypothetical protein [Jeongeupia sp. HS-3]|uniref:hypothetical protein n=1 Tax=Jeongeupia sp. HS-3 TaxID=1009682 RepID=UPI00191098ED|nr:hypothetical protein [Jeongeupia sp. HS-3]